MSIYDPLFVVAATREAYDAWCLRRGHDPKSRHIRFVKDTRTMNGWTNVEILFLDGWKAHPHAIAIYNKALKIQRKPS